MRFLLSIFITICQIYSLSSFEIPRVPCPDNFRYMFNNNIWSAIITVPTPTSNKVVITVNFSTRDINLASYGKLTLIDKDKLISTIKARQPFEYKIEFPSISYLPQVTKIVYDGYTFCIGPEVSPPRTYFWLTHTLNWEEHPHVKPANKPSHHNFNVQPTTTPQYINYWELPYVESNTKPPQLTFTIPPKQTYATKNPPINFNPRPQTTLPTPPQITKAPAPALSLMNRYENINLPQCGIIRKRRETMDDDIVPFVYNGVPIARNSHPWLAAMYHSAFGPLEFFCGGSLISKKHVLTAAHCMQHKNKKNVQVKVGAHNTKQLFDLGAVIRYIKSIFDHPSYSDGSAHGDISLIVLSEDVIFSNTIKPICLWNFQEDLELVTGSKGTIMGWGHTEKGEPSSNPLQTDVTIASQKKCEAVDELKNSISEKTFCAGTKGQGPCLGDSGGGLFIQQDGKWYIRGIISTSLAIRRGSTQVCDVNSYAVYVDIAKYLLWIVEYMKY